MGTLDESAIRLDQHCENDDDSINYFADAETSSCAGSFDEYTGWSGIAENKGRFICPILVIVHTTAAPTEKMSANQNPENNGEIKILFKRSTFSLSPATCFLYNFGRLSKSLVDFRCCVCCSVDEIIEIIHKFSLSAMLRRVAEVGEGKVTLNKCSSLGDLSMWLNSAKLKLARLLENNI